MSNSSRTRIVFLFGSGISYKAGMPSLYEITKRVLAGEGVFSSGGILQHISPLILKKKLFQKWLTIYLHRLKKGD